MQSFSVMLQAYAVHVCTVQVQVITSALTNPRIHTLLNEFSGASAGTSWAQVQQETTDHLRPAQLCS